jgi:GntR family histidine utilization transcriptional repressor
LVSRVQSDAPSWLRAKLAMSEGDQVLHIQCMHYQNNNPYQFEDRWINLEVVGGAADTDFKDVGPNEWLLREVPLTNAEITFTASRATKEIAKFLDSSEGDALFTTERTTWIDNRTVTFARLFYCLGYRLTTQI